eukprot:2773113-Rhodomonas_salina.1
MATHALLSQAYAPTRLRAPYAMSGTGICAHNAMPGTPIATRSLRDARYQHSPRPMRCPVQPTPCLELTPDMSPAVCLGAMCAACGTELAHGASCLRTQCAVSGTDLARARAVFCGLRVVRDARGVVLRICRLVPP